MATELKYIDINPGALFWSGIERRELRYAGATQAGESTTSALRINSQIFFPEFH